MVYSFSDLWLMQKVLVMVEWWVSYVWVLWKDWWEINENNFDFIFGLNEHDYTYDNYSTCKIFTGSWDKSFS